MEPEVENDRLWPWKGQIYSFGSRINNIIGELSLKNIILFQEDESKWVDLRLGFGAILTMNGQLIEFKGWFQTFYQKNNYFFQIQKISIFFLKPRKELFSNKNAKTPYRHLLSGIENIYSDPESYQFYFIQSEGGCLYDIATSVDFNLDPNERLKSLSETQFRHRPNGSGSRTNQNRLSNSLIKEVAFGCPDLDGRRISILTRENKVIRCVLSLNPDQKGIHLDYGCVSDPISPSNDEMLPSRDSEGSNDSSIVHCSFGSFVISKSRNRELNIKSEFPKICEIFENLNKEITPGLVQIFSELNPNRIFRWKDLVRKLHWWSYDYFKIDFWLFRNLPWGRIRKSRHETNWKTFWCILEFELGRNLFRIVFIQSDSMIPHWIDQWELIKDTHLFITLKLLWKILIGREDFE